MGKKVTFTGSHLLATELRRLRGVRTLYDMVQLSKSEPLCRRIRPLSTGTLSQVENAKVMPTLETLHALSVMYQVSTQHLLNFIVEERLCKSLELPQVMAATESAFGDALREARWYDALTLALHGETLASDETQRIAWRANRGSCLTKVGLRTEAIDVLMDCAESRAISPIQGVWIRLNLIEALMDVGRLTAADTMASATAPLVEASRDDKAAAKLLRLRARLILLLHEWGHEPGTQRIRDAQRHVTEAKRLLPADDFGRHFLLDLEMAECHRLLGNGVVARRDFEALLASAQAHGAPVHEAQASLYLGLALCGSAQAGAARRHLEHAASLAFRNDLHDEAFRAYFELLKLAGSTASADGRLLARRGRRLLPLVDRRSLAAQDFERYLGAAS